MSRNVERSIHMWYGKVSVGVLCLACLGELVCASTVTAAEIPAEIRQALEARVEALSPISVSWTRQLGSDMPLRDWLKMVKYELYNVDEFEPVRVRYAWQDGMSYSHTWQNKATINDIIFVDEAGEVRTKPDAKIENLPRMLLDDEKACNLKRVFLGSNRDAAAGTAMARLSIDSFDDPKIRSSDTSIFFDPIYFREAGFVLPRTIGMHRDGAKSLPLALIEEGAQVAKVEKTLLDGQTYILLELEDKELKNRFYLDPSRGYAVCRREEVTRSGQTAAVSDMSDFVKFDEPDIWLPKRCDVAYYTWRTIPKVITKKPLARRTFVVDKIDKEVIPVERFSLKCTIPGARISDSTLPQAKKMPRGIVRYEMPPDIEDLDLAIQCAIAGKPSVPRALREHNKALLEREHARSRSVRLTEDQSSLIRSMAEGPASANGHRRPIRVAIFDNAHPHNDASRGLGKILDSEPTCTWKEVSAADIRAGALNRFDVVIFPGGSSGRHASALQSKGMQAVRQFVRSGGGYVGICAGAFLAAPATAKVNGLGLVNAKTWTDKLGTAPRYGTVKIELTDAGERVFGEIPGLMDASYGGGPILSPAGNRDLPDYVPLAFYRTETWKHESEKNNMVDTAAIIATRCGSGRVLIFSPHPESIDETHPLVTRAVLAVARKPTDAD